MAHLILFGYVAQEHKNTWDTTTASNFPSPPPEFISTMDLHPLDVKACVESRDYQTSKVAELQSVAEQGGMEGVEARMIFPHAGAMSTDIHYHSTYSRTTAIGFMPPDNAPAAAPRPYSLLERKQQKWAEEKKMASRGDVARYVPKSSADFKGEAPPEPIDKKFHGSATISKEFKNSGTL